MTYKHRQCSSGPDGESFMPFMGRGKFGLHKMRGRGGPFGGPGGRGPSGGRGPDGKFGGRKGRGKRAFGHGDLRYFLLSLVAEQPRHGYDLIKEIEKRTGGSYKPSPGVVYPALEMLRDQGWSEFKDDDGKRTVHITKAGKKALGEHKSRIEKIKARLAELKENDEAAQPDSIRGAAGQLMFQLKRIAAGGELTDNQSAQIMQILKTASKDVKTIADAPDTPQDKA